MFVKSAVSGALISATLIISIILETLITFLTPKEEEYFVSGEIHQYQTSENK